MANQIPAIILIPALCCLTLQVVCSGDGSLSVTDLRHHKQKGKSDTFESELLSVAIVKVFYHIHREKECISNLSYRMEEKWLAVMVTVQLIYLTGICGKT